MRLSAWLLALVALAAYSSGSKILGIFLWPARSHYFLGHRLLTELASKGHEVTVLSPYKDPKPVPNYTEIFIPNIAERVEQKKGIYFDLGSWSLLSMALAAITIGKGIMEMVVVDQQVKNLLHSNQTFDVVVMDLCFFEPLLVFPHKFNAPLVYLSTMGNAAWNNINNRNPTPLASFPNVFMYPTGTMTFRERLQNMFLFLGENFYRNYILQPHYDQLTQKLYPGAPSIEEMKYNINTFMLANGHISTNDPAPRNPNVFEIGGFHSKKGELLPDDLQRFMDDHPEGVVYFGLGSNLKTTSIPIEKREAILTALGKIPHQVLWKWEEDSLPGQPANLRLGKWFPQQAILAHPNLKLFISHGGLLSTTEAVECGVPLLGIPIFGDQKMNIMYGVQHGFALSVPFLELTEEKLSAALTELLSNNNYSENAKKRSALMADRLVPPLDEAVYWVEYAIRHKGAPYMRNSALNLYWYEYEMLDVYLFLVIACFILPALLIYFFFKDYKEITEGEKARKKL